MPEEFKEIQTDDGIMPVERFAGREDAGVIVYMDGFGVRDELRQMCCRFARMGYTTFLPNLYYRLGSPSFPPPNTIGAKPPSGARAANTATTVAMSVHDTGRILSSEPGVRHWAVIGYCMGGRHAIGAAAAQPEKIKACLSIHGGNMIFDSAWSCERQIPPLPVRPSTSRARFSPSPFSRPRTAKVPGWVEMDPETCRRAVSSAGFTTTLKGVAPSATRRPMVASKADSIP